jgi:hypothetical protein
MKLVPVPRGTWSTTRMAGVRSSVVMCITDGDAT